MGAVSDAAPRGEGMQARLEEAFMAEREQEWGSFLAKSGKFDGELDQEIRIEKFTAAGPGEEEQNLERLRRWFVTCIAVMCSWRRPGGRRSDG